MTVRIRQRQKKYLVRKHVAYGRTYNYKDDGSYDHYTKGHRKSSLKTEDITKGNNFLNALIERAFPKVEDSGDAV